MAFDILLHSYPKQVIVEQKKYEVNCDFRTMIAIQNILMDEVFTLNEKMRIAITFFYHESIPQNIQKAFEAMIEFLHCYKKENVESARDILGIEIKAFQQEIAYDYQVDAERIYAAFYQVYGINLHNEKAMHWFEFKALFDNLNDGVAPFVQIMQIRTMKIDGSMSKQQQGYYRRMKQRYSLDDKRNEKNDSDYFAETFMQGMQSK